MKENTPISPQARAVLGAFTEDNALHNWSQNRYKTTALAAALRAAVMKCVYTDDYGSSYIDPQDLLTIAEELEAL